MCTTLVFISAIGVVYPMPIWPLYTEVHFIPFIYRLSIFYLYLRLPLFISLFVVCINEWFQLSLLIHPRAGCHWWGGLCVPANKGGVSFSTLTSCSRSPHDGWRRAPIPHKAGAHAHLQGRPDWKWCQGSLPTIHFWWDRVHLRCWFRLHADMCILLSAWCGVLHTAAELQFMDASLWISFTSLGKHLLSLLALFLCHLCADWGTIYRTLYFTFKWQALLSLINSRKNNVIYRWIK